MSEITNLVKSLADKHGRYQESLLPILQGVVEQHKYLSEEAMVEIARELDISAARVFEPHHFTLSLIHDLWESILSECKTITCMMHGKNQIIQELEKGLKIKLGETTLDGKFTLLETNCLGQCHKGPAMLINDEPYTELNPEKVREIIQRIKLNETSKTSNPDLN